MKLNGLQKCDSNPFIAKIFFEGMSSVSSCIRKLKALQFYWTKARSNFFIKYHDLKVVAGNLTVVATFLKVCSTCVLKFLLLPRA